jgi:hypothetical protein
MSIDTYVNILELYVANLNRYRAVNTVYFRGARIVRVCGSPHCRRSPIATERGYNLVQVDSVIMGVRGGE